MSNEKDKIKNSRRRFKDETAVQKQLKIAKTYKIPTDEPHKFAKHHATNCGDPKCTICANPRHNGWSKGNERLTAQERRLFQDIDSVRDKHSNGLNHDKETNQN